MMIIRGRPRLKNIKNGQRIIAGYERSAVSIQEAAFKSLITLKKAELDGEDGFSHMFFEPEKLKKYANKNDKGKVIAHHIVLNNDQIELLMKWTRMKPLIRDTINFLCIVFLCDECQDRVGVHSVSMLEHWKSKGMSPEDIMKKLCYLGSITQQGQFQEVIGNIAHAELQEDRQRSLDRN
ncbi:MAG: hypothetical protein GF411_14050 [Candidatus Lokiarchaeota archaeon]|nr:hypothetical protein [Candidatus Lokiarchaeota archaeon]